MKTISEKLQFYGSAGLTLFFFFFLINGLVLLCSKKFVVKRVASKLMVLMINHKTELLEEIAELMIRQPFICKVIMEFGKERVVESRHLCGSRFRVFQRRFKDNKKKSYYLEILYK